MANKSLTAAKYLATMHLEYQNFLIIGKTLPVHHPQNKREPEQTFKLPQDTDTSVEVTKDDDSTPSKTTKKEEKTERKRKPEPASKPSQEADEADETTNDDDNSSSMVAKQQKKREEELIGRKPKQEIPIKYLPIFL